jgi:hypothetical protein
MRKGLLVAAATLAVVSVAAYLALRSGSPETRFTGAYTLDDCGLVVISPVPGRHGRLRFRSEEGETGVLWEDGGRRYLGYEEDFFRLKVDWLIRHSRPRTEPADSAHGTPVLSCQP